MVKFWVIFRKRIISNPDFWRTYNIFYISNLRAAFMTGRNLYDCINEDSIVKLQIELPILGRSYLFNIHIWK